MHLALLLLPVWCGVLAQSSQNEPSAQVKLRILPLDAEADWLQKQTHFKTVHPDSSAIWAELQQVLRQLHSRAYIEASVDTLTRVGDTYVALLHLGPLYTWTHLQNGNVPEPLLQQAGWRRKGYEKRPLEPLQLQHLQDNLLAAAENNGYPFAQVWLDSLQMAEGQVSARLMLDRGRFVRVERLALSGELTIAESYLSNYLGLRPGTPYNRAQLLRARRRLRELPFANLAQDPTVQFTEEGAVVELTLDKRRASRFDFLIGVLPNSAQVGRMLVTGSFTGEMYNQFGRGERIYAEFEALRPQTQQLDLQFNYPYLLGLPFGVDAKFNLYKRDSTYLDVESDFGLQYLLEGGNYFKVFWNNRSSNLLNVDSTLLAGQRLPPTLDVRYGNFGLAYVFQNLDYRFNPRRGWSLALRGAAGVKQIRRNNRLEALENENFYDSLTLRSLQYRMSVRAERFFPVFNRATVKLGLQGAYILSDEPVYLNEQFRIGGNRLLRGFDEELIFATRYTVATLEYRLLIGQNSYLYTFGDYAYVEDHTATRRDRFFPFGFGAGITFETKAGLFGLSVAAGARQGEAIDFSAPKVHFGYVSLF
ncbi:MAG TPA: BamA/TamA family outer membrane protein [Saprospiraceae bacterium]|nr:BamA/TamA family outer membrane protein [Saprospiraceae bacterium]